MPATPQSFSAAAAAASQVAFVRPFTTAATSRPSTPTVPQQPEPQALRVADFIPRLGLSIVKHANEEDVRYRGKWGGRMEWWEMF